jgi:hypothetical protein
LPCPARADKAGIEIAIGHFPLARHDRKALQPGLPAPLRPGAMTPATV